MPPRKPPQTPSELAKAVKAHLAELDRIESRASIIDRRALEAGAERATSKLEAHLERYTRDGVIDLAGLTTSAQQARELSAEMVRRAIAPPDAFTTAVRDASRAGLELATELGALPNITRVDLESARRLAGALYAEGSPLRKLVESIPGTVGDAVAERLTTALLTGQNPRAAARSVMATGAELTRSRADTIARTELLRAQREATRSRLEDAPGIDEWVWLSAADSRTCAVCWAMHGTRHPVTETLDGHPNCRCTMVPAVPGGSADKIPTGDTLLATRPLEEQRRILGPKRHELWADGRQTLDDMVGRRSNGQWGTMRTLRPIDSTIDRRPIVAPPRPSQADVRAVKLDVQHTHEARELGLSLPEYREHLAQVPAYRESIRNAAVRAKAQAWADYEDALGTAGLGIPRPPAGKWEDVGHGSRIPGKRRADGKVYVRRYSDGTVAGQEWSFVDDMSEAEVKRMNRWWSDGAQVGKGQGRGQRGKASTRAGANLEAITDELLASGRLPAGATREDAIDYVLHQTRKIDAAASAAAGKPSNLIPARELDELIGAHTSHDVPATSILSSRDPVDVVRTMVDTAARHATAAELELAQELADDAARMLAPSYRGAGTGPAPWTMTPDSYAEEVLDLEYRIAAGDASPLDRERFAALVPEELDGPDALEEIHARIIATAELAGEKIPTRALPNYGQPAPGPKVNR